MAWATPPWADCSQFPAAYVLWGREDVARGDLPFVRTCIGMACLQRDAVAWANPARGRIAPAQRCAARVVCTRSTPRVDRVQPHRCERRRVTCCHRQVLRGCGCSDVSICVAEGQPGFSGVRRKRCKCVQIERQQAPLEQGQHLAFQPRMQCGPLAALGQVACTSEKCKHCGSVNLPGIDAAIPARTGNGNPGPPSPNVYRYGPGPRHTGSPWR